MYIKDYVRATYETVRKEGGADKTLKGLSAYLTRRGLIKLYPAILRGVMELQRRGERSEKPRVIVANEKDLFANTKEVAEALRSLGGEAHDTLVNDHLIGGYVVETKGKRIDASYKKKLLDAYHRLTAN